ncbi:MAG: SpoIID/LytB domain-containing protein [Lachnospiraceae bacterium]|nr:SpoIID/LytB domain-containing protein [Lachnospiraceae bacterium]
MSRKSFLMRIGGILALVLILIVLIVFLEPEKTGITRAQAAKAAALFDVSRETCVQYGEEREDSHFTEKEQKNWYVIYMDYLYDHGGLREEYTESTAQAAQQELTYREAELLAEFLGKKYKSRVNVTRSNREKPFPADLWWEIYDEAVTDQVDSGIQALDVILYGTPTNIETAPGWTCYTSGGDFRFEGLALDAYLDRKIRIYVRDGEVAGAGRLLSEQVVYENVWTESLDGELLSVHAGTITRQFPVSGKKLSEDVVHNIVDIHLKKGKLQKITIKKERVKGRVLAVGEDFIEIEGYGAVPLAPGFRVYKVYGEYEEQTRADILVGYSLQEFVAADGKLCAALTVRPFHPERIRVLLMDDGFQSVFHGTVELTLNCDAVLTFGEKEKEKARLEAGTKLTIQPGDDFLSAGRAVITPSVPEDGISVDSLSRSQGTPSYGGTLEIRQEPEGLVLVNDVLLEDYLKKVVPSEMPASYEPEALKAQAVCARTYAYRQIMGNSYSRYGAHVDDSTNYQVYNNTKTYDSTSLAVDETCGKLLCYEGQAAEAYYYSTSCGHGTDGSVWGGDGVKTPYLKAVELRDERRCLDLTLEEAFAAFIKNPDIPAYDSAYPMYRWSALYKGSTLGRQLGMGEIRSIQVTKRGPGGVAQELVITDEDGRKKTCSSQMEVRKALGSKELEIERKDGKSVSGMSLLPSAFIAVQEVGTAKDGSRLFEIYGGGYGHGAGMSQNGAQGMAKEGRSCEEILQFFYEGAEVGELEAG